MNDSFLINIGSSIERLNKTIKKSNKLTQRQNNVLITLTWVLIIIGLISLGIFICK